MKNTLSKDDRFGFARPALDAHTLGISSISQILADCGYHSVIADAGICKACEAPLAAANGAVIEQWIREARITLLGFSYRLDPAQGVGVFAQLMRILAQKRLLSWERGPIRAVFFAGLPETCDKVQREIPEVAGVFRGDETPAEALNILGVHATSQPQELAQSLRYDEDRLAFGKELIRKGDYLGARPVDRSGYNEFGTRADTVVARLRHSRQNRLPPLMRAHVGPYLADRSEAVRLFLSWTRQLAAMGFLDVLSIGTSQMTQSNFGEDWADGPNGGGVPLNSPEEYAAVWQAARPMLVRTYAGTKDIPALARMYEETINIAWHALSLWWFCQVDGRGPYTVRANLGQHIEALRYIASTGKPFEANVPHHFAFRGADDVTYVVSAILAARLAKSLGIRCFILQNMLNTPKYTWGVQDLAKSRAMLQLARELEDERFRVILQPRGGLDYFSPDPEKAKAQLAAVTALMDDIEPDDFNSPEIIHVVSYSEASHLADPAVVNESIQITRHALKQYRQLRSKGQVDDMKRHPDVAARTQELLAEARAVLHAIECIVCNPYTAEGLYQVFVRGFLPVPYLWEGKEEFRKAMRWQTRLIRGAMKVVDERGAPVSTEERLWAASLNSHAHF
ncbi:MAG: cobalamin-binding protein [Candidatus Sumerlaeota bacterium]|nr:cobalamin-binding protein [Candidatus Sumerlaeota bacterium]